jgi:hypothetical protein
MCRMLGGRQRMHTEFWWGNEFKLWCERWKGRCNITLSAIGWEELKVKVITEQAMKAQRGVEVWLYSFFNLGARWGWVVNAVHCCFTAGKETHYPQYRRLRGPQGQSGQVCKISSPLGFDSRTMEPIVIHYTVCAVPAHWEDERWISLTVDSVEWFLFSLTQAVYIKWYDD